MASALSEADGIDYTDPEEVWITMRQFSNNIDNGFLFAHKLFLSRVARAVD